jgi:hypothetical protein
MVAVGTTTIGISGTDGNNPMLGVTTNGQTGMVTLGIKTGMLVGMMQDQLQLTLLLLEVQMLRAPHRPPKKRLSEQDGTTNANYFAKQCSIWIMNKQSLSARFGGMVIGTTLGAPDLRGHTRCRSMTCPLKTLQPDLMPRYVHLCVCSTILTLMLHACCRCVENTIRSICTYDVYASYWSCCPRRLCTLEKRYAYTDVINIQTSNQYDEWRRSLDRTNTSGATHSVIGLSRTIAVHNHTCLML